MKQLKPGDDCGFRGTFDTGLIGEQSEVLINGTHVGVFLYNNLVHEDIDVRHLAAHQVIVRVHITIESVDGVTAEPPDEGRKLLHDFDKRLEAVAPKPASWFEKNYGWFYEQ